MEWARFAPRLPPRDVVVSWSGPSYVTERCSGTNDWVGSRPGSGSGMASGSLAGASGGCGARLRTLGRHALHAQLVTAGVGVRRVQIGPVRGETQRLDLRVQLYGRRRGVRVRVPEADEVIVAAAGQPPP